MSTRHHSHLSSAGLARRQFLAAPVASIAARPARARRRPARDRGAAGRRRHAHCSARRAPGRVPGARARRLNSTRAGTPGLGPSASGTTLRPTVSTTCGAPRRATARHRDAHARAARRGHRRPALDAVQRAVRRAARGGGVGLASSYLLQPASTRGSASTSHSRAASGPPSRRRAPAPPDIDDGFAGPPTPAPTDDPIEIVFTDPVAAAWPGRSARCARIPSARIPSGSASRARRRDRRR